jgi:hypothetical protein
MSQVATIKIIIPNFMRITNFNNQANSEFALTIPTI